MSEVGEKELFSCGADEFQEMTLMEMMDWLSGLAENQPCGPDGIIFRIRQYGDSWDGYDGARIEVFRDETPAEAQEREASWERDTAIRQAKIEADERAQLQRLKIKYEKEPTARND